ncbi:bridging integrator 2a [Mugil cephalus]|uniref:bridging integrator 2a n=1 Tax=Mugil cephalus TaxID=48193 RepID=UPI001FB7797F|nr:bridging integrator 2a [Mugil cephalus]XP_047426229.1 bridging integrator 2a [Mugil cephalus]XP_047426239.1 bridging integrator 2a [Mugil cephalus]
MAESTKGSSGEFAKKVQRSLSRGKEKVLQKLGKAVETKDDQFESCLQQFNDQQADGNRIYKDLRSYINAVRDMREASRRLSQSLFDVYESDWAGEDVLGAIVEGEDLLWNDYEVKLIDQAVHTMESYVGQFPDVKEKIAKRGRKLVDYDSSLHQLETAQNAKKRDDIKITKAQEEVKTSKNVYERINTDLKEELPVLFDSRIGCYVTVFSAVSNLREIFYKEMQGLNLDLQNVLKELQLQYPDKTFAVKGLQRYGSLKRRSLLSPRAWRSSFSDFHKNYSPRGSQRFSLKSPEKPRHSTLSRESSTAAVSSPSFTLENPISESRDLDTASTHTENFQRQDEAAAGASGRELQLGEDGGQVEEESKPPAESDNKGTGKEAPPSDSSSELNESHDSVSLELQLSAVDNGPLHIDETDDSTVTPDTPKANGLENREVSGLNSDATDQSAHHTDAPPEKPKSVEPKNTVV